MESHPTRSTWPWRPDRCSEENLKSLESLVVIFISRDVLYDESRSPDHSFLLRKMTYAYRLSNGTSNTLSADPFEAFPNLWGRLER